MVKTAMEERQANCLLIFSRLLGSESDPVELVQVYLTEGERAGLDADVLFRGKRYFVRVEER